MNKDLKFSTSEMELDHVAYLVRDTDASIAALARFCNQVTMYREPLANQKAFITYLASDDGSQKIELVEPFPENTLMHKRLGRKGEDSVLYHICYNVTDFDGVYRDLRSSGWLPVSKPFEGLNPGCRASHLLHPSFGIVEIAEVNAS